MKIILMILWSVILSTLSAAQTPISCAKPGSNGQNYDAQKQVPPQYPYAQPPYPHYAPPPYPMTWPQQGVNPYMQRGPMQPNTGQAMGPQQAMQPGFIPGVVPQQQINNGFVNSNGSVATFPQQSASTGMQYGSVTPAVACRCPKSGQKQVPSSKSTDPKIIAAEQKVAQSAIETAKAAAEAQKIAADSVASSAQEAQKAEQIAKEATQESEAKQQKAEELAIVAQNALAAIPASAANDDGVVKLYADAVTNPQSSAGVAATEDKGIRVIYSNSKAPVLIRPDVLTSEQVEALKAQAANPTHQAAAGSVASSSTTPAAATDGRSSLDVELDKMKGFSQALSHLPAA